MAADYLTLKEQAGKARAAANKAQGALDQLMARLQEEYGCDSIHAAESLLNQYEKECDTARQAYVEAEAEFKEKWADYLKGGE